MKLVGVKTTESPRAGGWAARGGRGRRRHGILNFQSQNGTIRAGPIWSTEACEVVKWAQTSFSWCWLVQHKPRTMEGVSKPLAKPGGGLSFI